MTDFVTLSDNTVPALTPTGNTCVSAGAASGISPGTWLQGRPGDFQLSIAARRLLFKIAHFSGLQRRGLPIWIVVNNAPLTKICHDVIGRRTCRFGIHAKALCILPRHTDKLIKIAQTRFRKTVQICVRQG